MSQPASNTIVGVPISLAYGHETGIAVLCIRTDDGDDYEFRATGSLATSLWAQVAKGIRIAVEYNSADPAEIVSFTVLH